MSESSPSAPPVPRSTDDEADAPTAAADSPAAVPHAGSEANALTTGGDRVAGPGSEADPMQPPLVASDPAPPAGPNGAATDGANVARPTYVFFGVVAALALVVDVATKAWAEITLSAPGSVRPNMVLIEDHLAFTLAYNRGGAWGLLHDASEAIRYPFFLGVSIAAVVFIVSLYSRLAPGQRALKWGLPLVLGGALGNLADRVVRSSVVDFIDYRADWIHSMNLGIAKVFKTWNVTDHWPTFNVADMCICAGVALMAIDMIASKPQGPRNEPSDAHRADARSDLPLAANGAD